MTTTLEVTSHSLIAYKGQFVFLWIQALHYVIHTVVEETMENRLFSTMVDKEMNFGFITWTAFMPRV